LLLAEAMNIIQHRSPHAAKLERWLGADKIDQIARNMRGWYGPPINLRDVPGSVWVTADGDFMGDFGRGGFASALDAIRDHAKQFWARVERERAFSDHVLGAGFTSISDALSRASQGYGQFLHGGQINKAGGTGVASAASSLWRAGTSPAAGAAGSAAPGGRIPTSATTGAMVYNNPASGTLHLVGMELTANVANNSLILYDRLFDVAKTMNSTATEAVTGVPTRYQSTTATNPDYIGGNFLFVEVFAALAATAHNWTVCTYLDQANAASTLPSLTGNSGAILDRFDHPLSQWFAPLEAGDVGVKALTQMQCSAAVATGSINFVIGHPIGMITFPVVTALSQRDFLTNMNQAPRIFDNACLALIEMPKPTTTATTYTGIISATGAA
jgi:hypothetical protein